MLKKYVSFSGLCLGFFIVMMDTTTVPLIYTTLMNEFNVSPIMVSWINSIYLITYAAFLLLGGRLGDSANRKTVVLVALLAIGLGAALSGAGENLMDVIVGRALMGIGAGLLTPQSMAYITILFPSGGRGTALGIWGAIAGVATASGPVITQFFLEMADWRWVMWINIPVAFVCFVLVAWTLPNDLGRGIKFWETLVSVLYGVCLATIIVGIQFVASGSIVFLGGALLVIGATGIVLLIKNELKKKRGYILPPDLWVDRAFLKACLISGALGLGLTSFYLPLAFLLNIRMDFGAVAISVLMVSIALSSALVGPLAGYMSDRMPPQIIIRYGLSAFAFANVFLGLVGIFTSEGTFAFAALCPAMIIAGAGAGLAFAPLANMVLGRAQQTTVGRAVAFFSSARQLLSALGAVTVAIVFEWVVRLQLGSDFEVTVTTLRNSSSVTATACLVCFLLITLSLSMAAYISRIGSPEAVPVELEQKYIGGIKT